MLYSFVRANYQKKKKKKNAPFGLRLQSSSYSSVLRLPIEFFFWNFLNALTAIRKPRLHSRRKWKRHAHAGFCACTHYSCAYSIMPVQLHRRHKIQTDGGGCDAPHHLIVELLIKLTVKQVYHLMYSMYNTYNVWSTFFLYGHCHCCCCRCCCCRVNDHNCDTLIIVICMRSHHYIQK